MSKFPDVTHDINRFDDWIVEQYEHSGGFTALVVLISIGGLEVVPLRSTYMHVIGDELDWLGFNELVRQAEVRWDGVVLIPLTGAGGGPVEDAEARRALGKLEKRIVEDRLVINEGHFFDKWGRRLKVEEAQQQ